VRAYVKQTTTVETTLNQIRKEVYAAIMLDKTLGLSFRVAVFPVGASAPMPDLADKQLGFMDINFSVRYTYQLIDASV